MADIEQKFSEIHQAVEAKFRVLDWGDKVNSGIGLSHQSARLHRLAGRYENPMPESTISPSQGL